jgi:hypothetical protein
MNGSLGIDLPENEDGWLQSAIKVNWVDYELR